jgi:predicted nucleic acid-binding protein
MADCNQSSPKRFSMNIAMLQMSLSTQYPTIDTIPILDFVTKNSKLIIAPGLPEPVCTDPDDDKFIACAIAAHCKIVVSGDKHLLKVSGYCGIQVVKPREFVDKFLATIKI